MRRSPTARGEKGLKDQQAPETAGRLPLVSARRRGAGGPQRFQASWRLACLVLVLGRSGARTHRAIGTRTLPKFRCRLHVPPVGGEESQPPLSFPLQRERKEGTGEKGRFLASPLVVPR